MEEKDRYEIHIYDDVCVDLYNNGVLDKSINDTYKLEKLLNQQDKRIKELEQENGYILFEDGYDKDGNEIQRQVYNTYKEEFTKLVLENKKLRKENQQLKQQLHDLPKKIVCEISESIERLSWRKRIYTNWEFDKEQLYKDLDTILRKYGGENESNND